MAICREEFTICFHYFCGTHGDGDSWAKARALELLFPCQDALVDIVCERDVALLYIVQDIEGLRDSGWVEATLYQLELLLLKRSGDFNEFLKCEKMSRMSFNPGEKNAEENGLDSRVEISVNLGWNIWFQLIKQELS